MYVPIPTGHTCCVKYRDGSHCKMEHGVLWPDGSWFCHMHDPEGKYQKQLEKTLGYYLNLFPPEGSDKKSSLD